MSGFWILTVLCFYTFCFKSEELCYPNLPTSPLPPPAIIFTWLSILSTRSYKTAVVPNFLPTTRPTMCFAKNPEKCTFYILCFLDCSWHFLKPGFTHTHSTLSSKGLGFLNLTYLIRHWEVTSFCMH